MNILLYNLNMCLETWKLRKYIRIVIHLAGIKLVRSDVEGTIALSAAFFLLLFLVAGALFVIDLCDQ